MKSSEDVFQVIQSLKDELRRLREVELEYLRLKREHEALLREVAEKAAVRMKPEETFHFYAGPQSYTGRSATSLGEFYDAIKEVPLQSIEHHTNGGDFAKWLRHIGLSGLADEFEEAKASGVSGEALRERLVEATRGKTAELAER